MLQTYPQPMAPPPNTPSLLSLPFLLLLFISLTAAASTTTTTATIATSSPLTGTQTITSDGGSFVLGFFKRGNSTPPRFYLGIWFNKVFQLTPVWVANRETPISDPTTSQLTISPHDGNLVLLNHSKAIIWSTNVSILAKISNSSTMLVAVILDTGNLVLRDSSDPSKVFWQSFDHPTDTWLPGDMLGLNKVTGERHQITTWKNSDDPAPGPYSLGLAPNGSHQFLMQRNQSSTYWTSGVWNGRTFSLVPEMTGIDNNFYYHYSFVSNATVTYFTFTVSVKNPVTRLYVGVSGQQRFEVWMENSNDWILVWSAPEQQCDIPEVCGPFTSCNGKGQPSLCSCVKGFRVTSPTDWNLGDQTKGCTRNSRLQCSSDRFYLMQAVTKLPDGRHSFVDGGPSTSSGECELACLSNCSCTAYSYSNSTCSVWNTDLVNIQQATNASSGVHILNLRLAASELPDPKTNHRNSDNGVAIGAIIGSIGGVAIVLAILLVLLWRRRSWPLSMKAKAAMESGALIPFRYRELQKMTKNFSEEIGRGGFGSVFKGLLPADSTAIAVKKLEGGIVQQGEKQFRTEVSTIGTIQHVNLVRLRGFCSEARHKLLVYEYMAMGSLDKQLFKKSNATVLSWSTRYQIALGVARGLAYLHERCRDVIIHCDIKPENILLDDNWVPKVADFGMAKLVGRDFSRVLTTMRGTIGYLAPEWIYGTTITTKADVYSYGMMLLEIISGRRNNEQRDEEGGGGPWFFATMAASKILEGDVVGLLDRRLDGHVDKLEEVERVCKVAFWCIQDSENYRPSMGEVVQILEGGKDVKMPPIPRSLQVLAGNQDSMMLDSGTLSESKVQ